MEGKIQIYYWPDGVWCYREEIEDYLGFKSDDYSYMFVPEELSYDEIDVFIGKHVKGL